jgi:hypothetical protein
MRSGIHRIRRVTGRTLLLASGLLVLPATCGRSQPVTAPGQQSCTATEARSMAGQPYSPALAEQARRAAEAREVRKIEPGGAYSTDLDPNRLNIEVDRAGIVTGLRCG